MIVDSWIHMQSHLGHDKWCFYRPERKITPILKGLYLCFSMFWPIYYNLHTLYFYAHNFPKYTLSFQHFLTHLQLISVLVSIYFTQSYIMFLKVQIDLKNMHHHLYMLILITY